MESFTISRSCHIYVKGYADGDWAGSVTDRKSTTGQCGIFDGNIVLWKSKKLHTVSRLSIEVEYRPMTQTTC